MADSPILKIPLLSANQSNKETTINDAITFLEAANNAAKDVSLAAGDVALTALDVQRFYMLRMVGATANRVVTLESANKIFAIDNSQNAFAVTLTRGSVSRVIPANTTQLFYVNGANLTVMVSGTAEGGGGGVTQFTLLTDVPNSYTGAAGKALAVTAEEDGLEFVDFPTGGTGGDGIADAPNDGKLYGRKNQAWAEVPTASGGTGGTAREVTAGGNVAATDSGNTVIVNTAAAASMTIPAGLALTVGSTIAFLQKGAGQTTVAGDSGVTVRVPTGFVAKTKFQYGIISAMCIGTNEYVILGALASA